MMPKLSEVDLPPIHLQKEEIGKRIARLRKKKGLTQKKLAEKMCAKRTIIADYERGKTRIYAEMVARIALALDTTADKIIGLRPEKDTEIIPSLRIMKRVKKIEELPPSQQKALLKNIDMYLRGAEKEV